MCITGCGETQEKKVSSSAPISNNEIKVEKDMHNRKILIAYYSQTGTTQKVAEKIKTLTGGDLFEIKPAEPYPLEHGACLERDRAEINQNARPKTAAKVNNMGQYDVLMVGYPIWYYQAPMVINSFLEDYNLQGKTIIPFCTSGGYPVEKSVEELKVSVPNSNLLKGYRYTGDSGLEQWIQSIKLRG